MRKMGGLARYMPVTYLTFLIGTLALCAIPPFSGFYSKDVIIEAVHLSTLPGAGFAYFCVLVGAFITPVYMFRALFMTFHLQEREDANLRGKIHETAWVILVPLVLLAIPSIVAGQIMIDRMLFSPAKLLGDTIFVLPEHNVLNQLAATYPGAKLMALEAGTSVSFWFAIAGIFAAWLFFAQFPSWSTFLKKHFAWVYNILIRKYGFDDFNQIVLVRGTEDTGRLFYKVGDVKLIDGVVVNGSGRGIRWLAQAGRYLQTGYIYQYALAMVIGILVFLAWYVGGF